MLQDGREIGRLIKAAQAGDRQAEEQAREQLDLIQTTWKDYDFKPFVPSAKTNIFSAIMESGVSEEDIKKTIPEAIIVTEKDGDKLCKYIEFKGQISVDPKLRTIAEVAINGTLGEGETRHYLQDAVKDAACESNGTLRADLNHSDGKLNRLADELTGLIRSKNPTSEYQVQTFRRTDDQISLELGYFSPHNPRTAREFWQALERGEDFHWKTLDKIQVHVSPEER
jgi:hypothetical protein